MVISIWRYSHLTLAISSFIFIVIAALTGIILAIEPITEKALPYQTNTQISIAKTITQLQNQYSEIISIERDDNNFVKASVITNDGSNETFFINSSTGNKIGDITPRPVIYQFATNLHRSLFLKSTGRIIITLVSFLLLLITLSGVALIAKRNGGLHNFFSKTKKESNKQYYHIILGKYTLIPIAIITISGIYLSLDKFSLLPKKETEPNLYSVSNTNQKPITSFDIFKNTTISDIKSLEFPFSSDSEDYFYLKTNSKELEIHQFNGEIISSRNKSNLQKTSQLNLFLHTGRGSIIWSTVLLLSCVSLLYFMYSGFAMTIERRRKNALLPKNKIAKNDAEYVILVGSESGNTYQPARLMFDALAKENKSVYITELNNFTQFKKMKHLIVMTSTYGEGDPPANASLFLKNFTNFIPNNPITFSVIGFGSMAYSKFCQFAIEIQEALSKTSNFIEATHLYKIHNQDNQQFQQWLHEWNKHTGLSLKITNSISLIRSKKQQEFKVIDITKPNVDNTFLLELKPNKKDNFTSGDLFNFIPKNQSVVRQYSIGKKGKNILLSIKKHELGLASTELSKLSIADSIFGNICKNKKFHLTKTKKKVLLISNGTGIAPLLGMIQQNPNNNIHLFWGGKTTESYSIYKPIIDKVIHKENLHLAFSREESKEYIQERVLEQKELVIETLTSGGQIFICGSLAMEKGVKNNLQLILSTSLNENISNYLDQIKSDCY